MTYELVFVLPGSLEKESQDALSQKVKKIFTDNGAVLKTQTEWGMKKLAYPVQHETTGIYLDWTFIVPLKAMKEIHRLLNFETKLLRYSLLQVN
ncbi:MAG: 30S ribosomal protein S6 [Patescibacteria group bacterium]